MHTRGILKRLLEQAKPGEMDFRPYSIAAGFTQTVTELSNTGSRQFGSYHHGLSDLVTFSPFTSVTLAFESSSAGNFAFSRPEQCISCTIVGSVVVLHRI